MRRVALLLTAFALAQVVLAVAVPWGGARQLRGDETYYQDTALRLARGETVPPLFLFPPAYPRFLAAIYRVAGPHVGAVALVQAGLLLAAALLLRLLLARAGLSGLPADLATLLLVVDPQVAAFAGYLWPEVLHLTLMLGALLLLLDGRSLAGGAALGAALLTRSLLGPFVPVLLAAAALAGPRDQALRRTGLAVAGLALVTLPVAGAHGLTYGYWGIANSGPFNVWVGLDDPPTRWEYDSVVVPAGPAYVASSQDHDERNRLIWARSVAKVGRDGVLATVTAQAAKQYGRLFDRESFFTDQLAGGRWRRAETPAPVETACRAWGWVAYGVTLALGAAGIVAWDWRSRWRAALLPASFLVYNLGLFLLLHVKTRYRVALLPALLFFAAAAIARLPRVPLRRVASASVAALLSLLLAFGDGCPPRRPPAAAATTGAVRYPPGP